jgi:hypothetical protein
MQEKIHKLNRMLSVEEVFVDGLSNTKAAKRLRGIRVDLLAFLREIGCGGDLSLIVATERAIVESDLSRYANSRAMVNSLKTALDEITAIERHIGIVDDPDKYPTIDQAHRLPRNRKGSLPFDEARQALASHYVRLGNLDKSRLDDDEKKIIDARKSAIFAAGKLYAERQAKTLGINTVAGGRTRGKLSSSENEG